MTKLTKPVSREAAISNWRGRPLVLSLCPPDGINRFDSVTVRLKGCRKTWRVSAEAVMWLAAKAEAAELAKAKRIAKQERAKARREK